MEATAVVQRLAQTFVSRAQQLHYRGKKRDDAMMDFFTGAVMLAETLELNDLRDHLGRILVMILSCRGYEECLRLARGEP